MDSDETQAHDNIESGPTKSATDEQQVATEGEPCKITKQESGVVESPAESGEAPSCINPQGDSSETGGEKAPENQEPSGSLRGESSETGEVPEDRELNGSPRGDSSEIGEVKALEDQEVRGQSPLDPNVETVSRTTDFICNTSDEY